MISEIALLMPITFSGYGENKDKNLVARSLVIAAGILLMSLDVGVMMEWMGLLWLQGCFAMGDSRPWGSLLAI